ncbi:MAG: TonB-dependent receptor [Gammaproteobacteria bacterium]
MKSPTIAGLTGILMLSSTQILFAEDEPLTIVVTASRGAETADETLVPVSVITREDIEKIGAISVPEVLATVPGVQLSNNGGLGQVTSVFLRGTESDHTLILIDGVKVGSATAGTTPFQDLPLDQVEKIEVVRGPRSSLYGSEAIGGVIQIFTRKGGQGTQPNFSVSGGSHNTGKINLGVSGGDRDRWYSVNASSFTTDGFNACRGSFEAGCFTIEPDDDGYKNTSVSLRAGAQINTAFNLEAGILNADGEAEFDGSFQNQSETRSQVGHVKGVVQATDNWQTSLLAGQTKDQSENFLNDVFASTFDTLRNQISWQNDILLNESRLIIGLDYTDEEVESDSEFAVTSRDNTGVFASYNTSIGEHVFDVSLREDDNEQFGNKTTGGIAYGYDLGEQTRVTFGYGTAFKAPSFNDLYFPGFGNPDLVPETSSSIDLGFSGRSVLATWSVNLFKTEIENLIGFDPMTFLPINTDEAEITGIEFAGSIDLSEWSLGGNLTIQDPTDTSGGPNDGNQLARRAKETLQLSADRNFGKWSAGASLLYKGRSYDDPSNLTELEAFTLVDIRTDYRVHENWLLGIRVNNIFDEEYETAAFYYQDGINALVTLSYQP